MKGVVVKVELIGSKLATSPQVVQEYGSPYQCFLELYNQSEISVMIDIELIS
jgi:hypothetical protein